MWIRISELKEYYQFEVDRGYRKPFNIYVEEFKERMKMLGHEVTLILDGDKNTESSG